MGKSQDRRRRAEEREQQSQDEESGFGQGVPHLTRLRERDRLVIRLREKRRSVWVGNAGDFSGTVDDLTDGAGGKPVAVAVEKEGRGDVADQERPGVSLIAVEVREQSFGEAMDRLLAPSGQERSGVEAEVVFVDARAGRAGDARFHQDAQNGTVSDAERTVGIQGSEDGPPLRRFKVQPERARALRFWRDQSLRGISAQLALRQESVEAADGSDGLVHGGLGVELAGRTGSPGE